MNKQIFHKVTHQETYFKAGDNTLLAEILHPMHSGHPSLPYSIAYASIEANEESLPHKLNQSELYIFIKGIGQLNIENHSHAIAAGHVILVPAGAKQSVTNLGKDRLEFYCIVNPPWSAEGEEII